MRLAYALTLLILVPAASALAQSRDAAPPLPLPTLEEASPVVRFHLHAAHLLTLSGDDEQARWHRQQALVLSVALRGDPLLAELLLQTWSGADWDDGFRTLYAYQDGLLTELLNQAWDGSAWVNTTRNNLSYEDGLLSESTSQTWTGGAWVNAGRTLITYDEDDAQTEQLYQSWTGSDWNDVQRLLFSYDGDLLTELLFEDWTGADWTPIRRIQFTHDADGATDTAVGQDWQDGQWVNTFRELQNWEDGNLLDFVVQFWAVTEWVNASLVTYTYDGDGQITELLGQLWTGASWENRDRRLWTYADGLVSEVVNQDWEDEAWVNATRSLYAYATETESEGVASPSVLSLSLFPSPLASDATVAFQLAEPGAVGFEIYDMLGRRVASLPEQAFGAGEQAVRWDLGALPSGVYVLRLHGAAQATRPFVVAR